MCRFRRCTGCWAAVCACAPASLGSVHVSRVFPVARPRFCAPTEPPSPRLGSETDGSEESNGIYHERTTAQLTPTGIVRKLSLNIALGEDSDKPPRRSAIRKGFQWHRDLVIPCPAKQSAIETTLQAQVEGYRRNLLSSPATSSLVIPVIDRTLPPVPPLQVLQFESTRILYLKLTSGPFSSETQMKAHDATKSER